jgi:hypothetical protein
MKFITRLICASLVLSLSGCYSRKVEKTVVEPSVTVGTDRTMLPGESVTVTCTR